MIYKFKIEVTDDDNQHIFWMRTEESGNFWWAFTTFLHEVVTYARSSGLHKP